MQFSTLLAAFATVPMVMAATCTTKTFPTSTGYKALSSPSTIAKGKTFNANYMKYDRGQSCTGQSEGGKADTVFLLEEGATLRNVIIGAKQREGIYCLGACTLENVWFEDVCEDAISLKGDGTVSIVGGGALKAADKIIQHNGCGHANIVNFYANDYGKVYRSCGNCKNNCKRSVHMEGVTAIDGGELMGINTNYGDTATYSGNCFDTKTQCQAYKGCDKSNGDCEATKSGTC